MRKVSSSLLTAICFTGAGAEVSAQDFPAVGTTFVYDVTWSQNGELTESYVSEITIFHVEQDIVTFTQCDLNTQECWIGETDGIFPGYYSSYDMQDDVPTRYFEERLSSFRDNNYYFNDEMYARGQYTPYQNGREITWVRSGSAEGTFTQTCCVKSEDGRDLWEMELEEIINGGRPTTTVLLVDPAIGWFEYQFTEHLYTSHPADSFVYVLTEIRPPN